MVLEGVGADAKLAIGGRRLETGGGNKFHRLFWQTAAAATVIYPQGTIHARRRTGPPPKSFSRRRHRSGRLEQPLAEYDRALSLTPSYARALNDRGVLLAQAGRLEEAECLTG